MHVCEACHVKDPNDVTFLLVWVFESRIKGDTNSKSILVVILYDSNVYDVYDVYAS